MSLTTVSIVAFTAYLLARNALKQAVFDQLSLAVSIKDKEINQWFNTQRQDVVLSASLPEIKATTELLLNKNAAKEKPEEYQLAYNKISKYLANLTKIKSNLQDISILSTNGIVMISTSKDMEGKYQPLGSTTTYFTTDQDDFKPTFYTSPITGKTAITLATPILNQLGNRIGVLSITLDLTEIDNLIRERTGLGESGETYLVGRLERKNSFISSQRPESQKYPEGISSLGIDAATQGQNDAGLYQNYNQVPVIGVYRWLDKQNLALLAEISQKEAFTPAQRLARGILLIGLSSVALLLIGVYVLSQRITRPILLITNAASQIAIGDFKHRTQFTSNDEIGILAKAFNRMAQQLDDSFKALENANQDLEIRVQERTVELATAKEVAEVANRAKSQFIAQMSHDLRTPLNSILGYAKLLKNASNLNPPQIKGLTTIERSGNHLLTLINDILDFSKVEARKMDLYQTDFHLPTFLQGIVGMMRMQAFEKNIWFEYEEKDNLPNGIHADEKRLRQILINLLGNAIKFTEQGQVRLQVSVIDEPEVFTLISKATIRFEVIDTGIGISYSQLEKIFQPFEQVGDSKNRKSGTGLGLAISRQLVQIMGNELKVKSELGKGSTFWFDLTFPVVEVVAKAQPKIEPRLITYRGQRHKLLVVDDQPENSLLLLHMLEGIGFEVAIAENGMEGLEIAQKIRPDLILTDLFMPIKTGFTMVPEIREIPGMQDLPIIALSASSFEIMDSESKRLGCNAFLRKPIQQEKLLALLEQYLQLEWVYNQSEFDLFQ
ncbi:MAG: response regulator [Symploca sp. SIO2E9]|nr:response regulator [Symploca sp. SIO2E9]